MRFLSSLGGLPFRPKQSQYCLAPKFIWGSIKKQNLEQTGFSLLVERRRREIRDTKVFGANCWFGLCK
jgi:hypothetical protein